MFARLEELEKHISNVKRLNHKRKREQERFQKARELREAKDKVYAYSRSLHRLRKRCNASRPERKTFHYQTWEATRRSDVPSVKLWSPVSICENGNFRSFLVSCARGRKLTAVRWNTNRQQHEVVFLTFRHLHVSQRLPFENYSHGGIWLPSDVSLNDARKYKIDVFVNYNIDSSNHEDDFY